MHAHMLSLQLCLTLYDLMNCNLPGSCVHGILQGRIQEWAAMPSSRESSQPSDQTRKNPDFYVSCIGRWVLYHWATREDLDCPLYSPTDDILTVGWLNWNFWERVRYWYSKVQTVLRTTGIEGGKVTFKRTLKRIVVELEPIPSSLKESESEWPPRQKKSIKVRKMELVIWGRGL